MNGIDATKAIHDINKDTKIIILTSHNDEKESFTNSLKAGAKCILLQRNKFTKTCSGCSISCRRFSMV